GQIDGEPPNITSPLRGNTYTLRVKQAGDTGIALNANADASAHLLYWFVNDAYVGHSAPGATLFWQPATAGDYTVRVIDDHGRSDQRPLAVGLVQ
ncbi:MAG: penicillin-binding protein 1C, partial [Rhodanobacter sp.]|nr:penicillin-binding protein 1C [Rhodanobacter sp.]